MTREADLVAGVRHGDEAAFEELYRAHRDWVYSLALRHCGRREEALDVVQETFAWLLRSAPRIELRVKLTTLLHPVVRHLAEAARRRARRFEGDVDALEAARARAEPALESQRAEFAAAVAALPDAQRDVLLARFVDGLSLEEIAQALAIPIGTVKSRLHHSLASLRSDPRARRHFEANR